MVNSIEFSKRLQKILNYYGVSATAFSEKLAVNRSTISHLLSGRNKPSLEFVMKVLAEFPEVELYWLLNGTGTFPSSEIAEVKSGSVSTTRIPKQNTPQTAIDQKSTENSNTLASAKKDDNVERIVIFYKDGSFKSYQ